MYDNFFGLRKIKCHWITKKSNLGFKDSEKIFRQKGNTVTINWILFSVCLCH